MSDLLQAIILALLAAVLVGVVVLIGVVVTGRARRVSSGVRAARWRPRLRTRRSRAIPFIRHRVRRVARLSAPMHRVGR